MKKLLISLLFFATGFCFGDATIVSYEPVHKDAAMEIFFQDTKQLFVGSAVVDMGLATAEEFNAEAQRAAEASLVDANKVKWVVIDSGKVVGFIEFFVTKEQSLESVIMQVKEQYENFTSEQKAEFASTLSYLKKTDAECDIIGKIECIAISKDSRRRGHARSLIRKAIECIKHVSPMVKRVVLEVNMANENARKLYESEGFKQSAVQPQHFVMLQVVQYEKAL